MHFFSLQVIEVILVVYSHDFEWRIANWPCPLALRSVSCIYALPFLYSKWEDETNRWCPPYLPPSATLFEQNSLIGFQNAMPKLRVLTKGEGGRIPRFRPHPWIRGPFLGVEFQWISPEMWTLHHPAHEQSRGLKYSWHELRFFV